MAFTKVPFRFFRGLARNDNKAWFEAHRAEYEREVREPMRHLIDRIAKSVKQFGGLDDEASLKRMPRGFPETHPAAKWLRQVVHRGPSSYGCRGNGCPASGDSGERICCVAAIGALAQRSARVPNRLEFDHGGAFQVVPLVVSCTLARGSESVKRVPFPTVLSTVRSPFIARASSRLIANPSPTPPSRSARPSFS